MTNIREELKFVNEVRSDIALLETTQKQKIVIRHKKRSSKESSKLATSFSIEIRKILKGNSSPTWRDLTKYE